MVEKQVCTEIVNSFKAAGAWAYKIPDAPTRFAPEKPCDIVVCDHGELIAIEVKLMKKWGSINIKKMMRPSQIKHLTLIEEAGGQAYVFVNVRMAGINKIVVFRWCFLKRWMEKDIPIAIQHIKNLTDNSHIKGSKGLFPQLRQFLMNPHVYFESY